MKIGIDIDDTTLVTVKGMIKYGDIFCQEVLKRPNTKSNLSDIKDRYYLGALYGWSEETKFQFFNMYYKNVLEECTPIEKAPETITKLKEEGNGIYFISARLTSIKDCPAEEITIDTFTKYQIPYDKIIIAAYDKLQYCLENGIEVFIDDSYDVLKELTAHGIRCYLMTTPMNSSIQVEDGIKRVHTWDEIYNDLKEVTYDSKLLKRTIN